MELISVENQVSFFAARLDEVFGGWFPGASSLSSLWLFPYLGTLQGASYSFTGVKRSHFTQVVLFGLVVGDGAGVVNLSRFSAISVIFFGVSKYYSQRVMDTLLKAGYVELKYMKRRAKYYGFTEKGAAKWSRVLMLFNKRMQERAALLRHMEEIGKPVRFDAL